MSTYGFDGRIDKVGDSSGFALEMSTGIVKNQI